VGVGSTIETANHRCDQFYRHCRLYLQQYSRFVLPHL